MAQQLKVLVAVAKDPGSVPTPALGVLMVTSDHCSHQAQKWHTDMHMNHPHRLNK